MGKKGRKSSLNTQANATEADSQVEVTPVYPSEAQIKEDAQRLISHLQLIEPEKSRKIQAYVSSLTCEESTFEVIRQLHAANTVLKEHCLDYQKLSCEMDQCDGDIVSAHNSVDDILSNLNSLQAQSQWVGQGGEKARARRAHAESSYLDSLGRASALLEQKGSYLNQRCEQQVNLGAAAQRIPSVDATTALPNIEDAIARADDLIDQCQAELEPAVLETRATIVHLLHCLAKEEEIVQRITGPLTEAKKAAQAVVTLNAATVAGETPATDALHTAVLKQEVTKAAAELNRAKKMAEEARGAQNEIDGLNCELEKIADDMEDLTAEMMKLRRKKQDEMAGKIEEEIELLTSQRRTLAQTIVRKQAMTQAPELNRWFPEIVQGSEQRQDLAQPAVRLFDRTRHINHFKQKQILSMKFNARVLLVEDSFGEWVLKELPRNREFEQEALRLHLLAHPLVVHVECIFFHDKFAYVQMPYYEKGNLRAWTEHIKTKQGKLTASDRVEVRETFKQIFQAVSFIHQNGVAHRDIKPENVLIQDSGLIALCDFGCSRDLIDCSNTTVTGEGSFTEIYAAPEVALMASRRKHLFALDAWSLGVMLLEIMSGKAYQWNRFRGILEHNDPATAGIEEPTPLDQTAFEGDVWQRAAWSLAARLLHENPTNRPSIVEALSSDFFMEEGLYMPQPVLFSDPQSQSSAASSPASTSGGSGASSPARGKCAGASPMQRKTVTGLGPADAEVKEKFGELDRSLRSRREAKQVKEVNLNLLQKKKKKAAAAAGPRAGDTRPHFFLRVRSASSGGSNETTIRDMITRQAPQGRPSCLEAGRQNPANTGWGGVELLVTLTEMVVVVEWVGIEVHHSFEQQYLPMESAFSVTMGNTAATERPLSEAVSNFFSACSHPGNEMFEQGSTELQMGLHYLPRLDAAMSDDNVREYQAVGRILAKCLLEGIPVSLPFSQAMHSFLLGNEALSDDVDECINLMVSFDPQYANLLHRTLLHRHATGRITYLSVGQLAQTDGVLRIGGMPANDIVTDLNKHQAVCACVRYALVESRRRALTAIRDGFAMLNAGQDNLLQGFTNADLAAGLHAQAYLDIDQVLASFSFTAEEWDGELSEYRTSLQQWMAALLKGLPLLALRVLLARTTGSTTPPPKDRTVSVHHINSIPRYVEKVEQELRGELYIMPHSRSLYIPTFNSFQEFRSEMLTALDLYAYITPSVGQTLAGASMQLGVATRAGGWYQNLEGKLVFGATAAKAALNQAAETLGCSAGAADLASPASPNVATASGRAEIGGGSSQIEIEEEVEGETTPCKRRLDMTPEDFQIDVAEEAEVKEQLAEEVSIPLEKNSCATLVGEDEFKKLEHGLQETMEELNRTVDETRLETVDETRPETADETRPETVDEPQGSVGQSSSLAPSFASVPQVLGWPGGPASPPVEDAN
ncbi:hypothetical protein CYMTET_9835 [Cymbomonas tetramitiformis]|uniref:Protein kinase domain-containing protein n=1 Tax=Cymbomonas tetramitiformis TaxID=36881 RepID=A0AAE0LF29_9CHLO|nr:hypothetical protein CYMTET_9835 [Cymbomonas tetramitiformis]